MITGKKTAALLLLGCMVLAMLFLVSATPTGPSVVNTANSTKVANSAASVNITGGTIATFNITANTQNTRWKAFIGWVTGKFTLDDSSGSTIYDWTISTTNGKVFATRNSSTVAWASINCSNTSLLEAENTAMNQTNPDDNITKTFKGTSHDAFWVGNIFIPQNTCPTLHTYVNNATQSSIFQEMAMSDTHNIVYATKVDANQVGYNGNHYDFQMLVPENGAPSFSGVTPYYMYVELT